MRATSTHRTESRSSLYGDVGACALAKEFKPPLWLVNARLLDETTAMLAQRLGRAPTQDELAKELGVDQAELGRMLLESAHVIVSLDGANGGDDEGEVQSLRDLLHDPDETATDEVVEENELVERLSSAIDSLPPRDRQ